MRRPSHRSIRAIAGTLLVILSLASGLALTPAPASAQALPVPLFGQQWDPWQWDKLGFDRVDTIHRYGCGVTCLAMIHKYYGVNTDPRDMNNWLKANGGFSDDYLIWNHSAGRGVSYAGGNDYERVNADLNAVNSEIDGGHPVIVEVRLFGGLHYLVVTGRSGGTYFINDPWFGDRSTLNARYGSPAAAIYFIHRFRGPVPVSGGGGPSRPATAPGGAPIHYIPFSGIVLRGFSGAANARSGPSTSYGAVQSIPANTTMGFIGWCTGQSVPDAWTGRADDKWFLFYAGNTLSYISSAVVYGNPPG